MNIGEKIKELRTRKQMTQAELAGDNVSRNMVSLIENGRATPSMETLAAIAAKLKVTTAFLVADDRERAALTKQEILSDIRIAFSGKNYRICTDLCRTLYKNGLENDDEVDLIMAESLLGTASEAFLNDRIRLCRQLLDEAVLYAYRTVYRTEHILCAAWWYFEYMGLLSPSLISENMESDFVPDVAPRGDVFCRYMAAVLAEKADTFPLHPSDPAFAGLLAAHIQARSRMREKDYEKAINYLAEILHSPDILPGIVMYHVFCDMEECCRRLGNRKNETNYREAKLSIFEKLLS